MRTKPYLFAIVILALAHQTAFTANLPFGLVNSFVSNSCWLGPSTPATVESKFTLPGVNGVGVVRSSTFIAQNNQYDSNEVSIPLYFFPVYTYSVDMSGMSAGNNHNVQLSIYFGTPASLCSGKQVFDQAGSGLVPLQSAMDNLSSIYLDFGTVSSPYLNPGQTSTSVAMSSDQDPKTNYVTIIDDYVDQASGLTNHYSTKAAAIVPDIPPIYLSPLPPLYQGLLHKSYLGTNGIPNPSGTYDLGMQLYNAASNGLPIGPMKSQSITVSNGLFTAPMNFDTSDFFGGQRWLSLSVSPAGSNTFTTLNPPQPISPTPQAVYAYAAGRVADLSPGQALTSLNGLTDTVTLQPGTGINFDTNGNSLVISTLAAGASDRSLKTNFADVNPRDVLARLTSLPVQTWRYTNEQPDVRHMGPMAQDFRDAFKLGNNDKLIGYLDETGVAIAAIQGLNQKLNEKDATLIEQTREIRALKTRLELLEAIYFKTNQP